MPDHVLPSLLHRWRAALARYEAASGDRTALLAEVECARLAYHDALAALTDEARELGDAAPPSPSVLRQREPSQR